MKRLLFCLLALLISTTALAGGVDDYARITALVADAGGHFFVYVSPNISNGPACASSNPYRFVIDSTQSANQAMVAMLLLAQAQGRQIDFNGYGTCSVFAGIETAQWIVVH